MSYISALAWNNAIQSELSKYNKLYTYGPWIYAIVITLLSIIIAIVLGKLLHS